MLGFNAIEDREWQYGHYGESTAAAVLAYKRSRNIVNRAYQQQADDIVGVMTIAQLDKELTTLESSARPRFYKPPTGGFRDSAAHFELRRCISLLRHHAAQSEAWSDAIMSGRSLRTKGGASFDPATVGKVVSVALDNATEFFSLLRGTGPESDMVGPAGDSYRARICQPRSVGATFAQVKECWGVVETTEPAPPKIEIHWCGIFASYIWKTYGPLKNVSWSMLDQTRPGVNANKKPVTSSFDMQMLTPGDILIDQRPLMDTKTNLPKRDPKTKQIIYPNHHMLILSIRRDRKRAWILQGNSGGNPPESSIVTHAILDLPSNLGGARTHSFKSIDTVRWGNSY